MRALLAAMMAASLAIPAAAQAPAPYRIVADQRGDTSRTVDVRIERRLDESELSVIANAIADRDAKPATRITINFVLPSARQGDAPWASATLHREVKLKVAGLRLEEERLFRAEAQADRRAVIGSWLTSTPATPGRVTIYREDNRLFAEWRMRSGVTTRDEVRETKVATGRRFDLRSGVGDDHFIMIGNGDLEMRAKGTLITVAERIRDTDSKLPAVAARDRASETERWPSAAAPTGFEVRQQGQMQPTSVAAARADAEPEPAAAAAPAPAAKAHPRPVRPKGEAPARKPPIDLTIYLNQGL